MLFYAYSASDLRKENNKSAGDFQREMRILSSDMTEGAPAEGCEKRGEITLIAETLDDLWHLRHLIEPGDIVVAVTYRSEERRVDRIRPKKAEKKPVKLSIRVKEVEFQKFSRRLRVKGIIEHGLEDETGSHHTINVETQMKITIIKECWKKHHIARLNRATERGYEVPVILLTIEEGEAVAGMLHQYGVDEIFSVKGSSGKRIAGETRKEFFGDVLSQLKQAIASSGEHTSVIVAGPGFIKDEFLAFMRERAPEITARKENISSIGTSGFLELLKRGILGKMIAEERLSREIRMFDKLLEEISKGDRGKAAYGIDDVERCVKLGAVETLLLSDDILMSEDETLRKRVENIMHIAEQTKSEVIILSTEFEPGKRLSRLCGVAALLRFNVND